MSKWQRKEWRRVRGALGIHKRDEWMLGKLKHGITVKEVVNENTK